MTLSLTSPVFEHEGEIPTKYTCEGEEVSPPLAVSGVPEGAKSLVLIMDDPDAIKPANRVWDHWVVFNIPIKTAEIVEGENPTGTLGANTSSTNRYQGPCPPDAEHRYFFKLYALDSELNFPEGSTKADVEAAMEGHILEKTELMGRYCKEENRASV